VWTKYPVTENTDGTFSVKLADIYGDERRDILCRVKLPKLDAPVDKEELVSFNVEYFNVLSSQLESVSAVASMARPEECDAQVSDYFLDRERNRLVTAEAMLEARTLADSSKLDAAKAILKATVEKLQSSISGADKQTLEYIKDLNDAHNDMVSREQYSAVGAKKMAWKEQKMSKQRAAADSEEMETTSKYSMKQAFYEQKRAKEAAMEANTSNLAAVSIATPSVDKPAAPAVIPQPVSHPQTQTSANRYTIQVGNTHVQIPEDIAEESKVTPGAKLTHDWTLYVRGTDLSFIEKVVFTIHSTFSPNVITVASAPFEISRKGWGFFNTKVSVHYKPGMGPATPTEVVHELCFSGNGNFQEVVVNW